MKRTLLTFSLVLLALLSFSQEILLETEAFDDKGGWVVDAQFVDNMGSPYLLAHGLGNPVKAASTNFKFPEKGIYHFWVRTKDWAPFPQGPGKFQIQINDKTIKTVFGASGDKNWKWYYAGTVEAAQTQATLVLKDLTGFEGRCDAIFFSKKKQTPPNQAKELALFRKKLLGLPAKAPSAGEFDFVVIGGGIAGTAAAVQASRLGLKTALIQNRPVLGGNNSSEIRVHLMGRTDLNHYPKLGRIVRELDNGDPGNAGKKARDYGDRRKYNVAKAEKNLKLFLNMHAFEVEKEGTKIKAVIAKHNENALELRFEAPFFADCTGDGNIGFLAGADYRMGRESRQQTGESLAPEKADDFTMGTSNLWYAVQTDTASSFPECPWALQFSDEYHLDQTHADWRWETGFGNFNTITEAEEIRDHNFRAIYGNWAYLKNHQSEKYQNYTLGWVAYVGGKRESRRLLGDIILKQEDLQKPVIYPDGFVTSTWSIDLHYPDPKNSKYFPGEEFISTYQHPKIQPYPIPLRCLYSRNVPNLMMAGRDISVTHVALGTVRVMRTGGMMGEVVAHVIALCKKHQTNPRGVYQYHLDELKEMLSN